MKASSAHELIAEIKGGMKFSDSILGDLYKQVCQNPIFEIEIGLEETKKKGKVKQQVILHFLNLESRHVEPSQEDKGTLKDAEDWVEENCARLTLLGIEGVRFHLAPAHPFDVRGSSSGHLLLLRKQIGFTILSILERYETVHKGMAKPFNSYLIEEAGALGLITSTEKLLGPGSWERVVKKTLLDTGRYREDVDGAVVRM